MNTEEFLRRTLPPDGTAYYSADIPPGEKFRQHKLNSITDLLKDIERLNNQRHDVYYATGSFKNSRTQPDTELKKCFYIDLDCGVGVSKYSTKKEAASALLRFAKDHFVSPSLLIDSGGGVHAYWVLDQAVPLAKWQPIADSLKDSCRAYGFSIDEAVTADAARVMRVPGSTNFKHGSGKACKVFYDGGDYTIEELRNALNVTGPAVGLVVDNDDLALPFEERTWYAKHVVNQCPMFKDAMETGGADLPEALWSQQLHVLTYCTDGEDFVHEISKGYAGYAWAETNQKWNQKLVAKARDIGPTTCDKFSELSKHCQTCFFRSTVKSPLHLGDGKDHSLPRGYYQDDDGIYYVSFGDDGEAHRTYVTDFNIKNFRLLYEKGGAGLAIECSVINQTQEVHRLVMELRKDVTDKSTRIAVLAESGIIVERFSQLLFEDLLVSWAKAVQNTRGAEICTPNLGWATNSKSFALVEHIYYEDGSARPNANVSGDKHIADMYTPRGKADAWMKTAALMSQQKRYGAITAVLTAFASPLLHFLKDSNVIISFVSPSSGTGKTTSLQMGQAVWGDPRRAMNQMDDTENSVFNKLGYLNSLPAYWDEVRTKNDPGRFVRLLFQLTLGREKSRLTQTISQRQVNTWETMLVIASNESIADHAKAAEPTSEAGRVRVFEVLMPDLEREAIQNRELPNAMNALSNNYGVIGPQYAEFLVRNHKKLDSLVNDIYLKFTSAAKNTNERLWLSTVTVLYVAAHLANKLGYMDIDLAEYREWLEEQLEEQREDVANSYKPKEEQAPDFISELINHYRPSTFIYDKFIQTGRGADVGKIYFEPRDFAGPVVGAIALENKKLRISKREFDTYCRDAFKSAPKDMLRHLTYRTSRRAIDPRPGAARIMTYDIWLDDEYINGCIE